MADDVTNPFASILGALQSKGGKGNGVRKDTDPKAVSPTLTTQERSRYENIFGIMKDVLKPDPEAQRIGGTAAAAVGGTAQMQAAQKAAGGGSGIAGILGGLALGAGVIGAAIATLVESIQGKFAEFGEAILDFGSEVASDIGKLPAMAAKLAKFIPFKTLKFLPLVGSLISFGLAWQHFKKGEFISGGWELVSGIANLFPGAGTAISIGMDMIKFIYEANAPVDDKGKPIDFGAFLKAKAMEYGTIILDKIKDGRVPMLSGVWKLGEAIGYFISGDIGEGFKSLMNFFPAFLGAGDVEQMYNAMNAIYGIVMESEPVAVAKQMAGDAWGWMKDVFSDIGEVFVGFFDGIKEWISDTIQAGKDLIWDMIPDVLKKDEKLKAAQNSAFKSKTGDTDATIKAIMDRDPAAFAAAKGAGVAEFQSYLRSQGFKKIEDGYISKNGNVTAYDSQDDLLAARAGGPIDKMLDANSKTMSDISDINKNQLAVMIQIRDGINTLVAKSGGPTQVEFTPNPLTQEFYA